MQVCHSVTNSKSGLWPLFLPTFDIACHSPLILTCVMSDVKSVTLGPSLAKSEDPTAKISTGTSSFSKRRIFDGLKPPEATILTLSHH